MRLEPGGRTSVTSGLPAFLAQTSGVEYRESRWRQLLTQPANVTQGAAGS